jgi:hypothetical protein
MTSIIAQPAPWSTGDGESNHGKKKGKKKGAFGFADGEDRWAVSGAPTGTCTGHEKSLPGKWIGLIPFLQLARW